MILIYMLKKLINSLILLVFIASFTSCTKATTPSILGRVAVTGASVTAGHGVKTLPIKGDFGAYTINMKHILEGMINVPHDDVEYFGDLLFFTNPRAYAKDFVEQINNHKPTLLVAVDFLFWFGHGSTPIDRDPAKYRMEKMNFALDLLDQVDCQIVVGNLPNVRAAIGKLLTERQVPTPEILAQLNERIGQWGDERQNVIVIDAFQLWDSAMNGNEISMMGATWPIGSQSRLLQEDMLHTTLEGTIAASLLVAQELDEKGLETNLEMIKKRAASAARKD